MADNKITIEIDVEGDASKEIAALIKRFKDLETTAPQAIKKMDLAFGSFIGNLAAGAVQAGFRALSNGISNVISLSEQFAKESVKAAAESESAINSLNVALQLTGNFSEEASKNLQNFASGLEAVTTFSDEAILSSIALTETLTGLDEKALQQVTKATVDYASILGVDLDTATRNVAKAIEGNTSALERQGISIKKGKNEAEQLANTLRALGQFNGAAEAKAKTFAGATAQLSNQFNNLQEAFGNLIVRNPAVITAISTLSRLFQDFAKRISENEGAGKRFVQNVLVTLLSAVEASIPAVQGLARAVLETARAVAFLGAGASGTIDFLRGLAGGNSEMSETTKAFAETVQNLGKNIEDLKGSSKVFDEVRAGVRGLKEEVDTVDVTRPTETARPAARASAAPASSRLVEQRKKEIDEITKLNEALFKRDAELNEEEIAQNDIIVRQKIALAGFEIEEKEKLFAEQDVREADRDQKRIETIFALNEQLAEINLAKNEEEILANEAKIQTILEQERLSAAEKQKIQLALQKADNQRDEKRLQAVSGFFGDLSSLQNTKSRELFEIGKVAAIAQATIDGFLAVQKALSAFPPPFNFIAAAGVAVKTGVNIAGIASQEFKAERGLTEVPAGFPNDSFPARLTSGERVVSADQNADLKQFMSADSVIVQRLDSILSAVSHRQPVVVNVGGDTILDTLQEEIDSGRMLRL